MGLPYFPARLHRRIIGLAVLAFVCILSYIYVWIDTGSTAYSLPFQSESATMTEDTCTPQAYASGRWVSHVQSSSSSNKTMTRPEDSIAFGNFTGCASSREVWWHLAADRPEQYGRFPDAQGWVWVPGEGCEILQELRAEELVRTLVKDGGWYLLGDSVTENHFFSLSCLLFPHVIATPDYTSSSSFDRAWPQHLFLAPNSPLAAQIQLEGALPPAFDIARTPLVTFRRNDLLLDKEGVQRAYERLQAARGEAQNATALFSTEAVWTLPPAQYLTEFLKPRPDGGYATLVASTGGHWTTTLLGGAGGMEGVHALFTAAMAEWASGVQDMLRAYHDNLGNSGKVGPGWRKRAVARAYLPGHEDCHAARAPWTEVQPFVWNWYNWEQIGRMNTAFETLLADKKRLPDVHFLGIDRPGRLRPDAHTTGDCLHIMTGAGVLEGWSHYISRFIMTH